MARRKETTPANVPSRGHPDRKRVLNVLAQQRYRQRARERVKELEAKAAVAAASKKDNESKPEESSSSLASGSSPEEVALTDANSPLSTISCWRNPSSSGSSTALDGTSPPNWMDIDPTMMGSMDSMNGWFDLSSPPFDLAENLQSIETAQFTFPDDSSIEVPALQVLKAAFHFASMLGCETTLWDPAALTVVDPMSTKTLALPPTLRPVDEQVKLPHHPMFDILPWPTVRKKLIQVFSLPPEMRPPAARDPLAVVYLAYDLEDPVEGVRIAGSDSCDPNNWEIGQVFFSKWWWALDQEAVQNSNRLREARGAPRLLLTNS